MPQFDVYQNKGRNKRDIPLRLDIQSDLISGYLDTSIIVPLFLPSSIGVTVVKLHVPVIMKSKKYVAIFDQLAVYELAQCGPKVGNLKKEYENLFKLALYVLFLIIRDIARSVKLLY